MCFSQETKLNDIEGTKKNIFNKKMDFGFSLSLPLYVFFFGFLKHFYVMWRVVWIYIIFKIFMVLLMRFTE